MIVISRNFKKEELDKADTVIGRMYRKVMLDSQNEQLTERETYISMQSHPFIKDVIISILKGSKIIPDNRYWMSVTIQISNILSHSKSLSYFDAKGKPAMFVWGFRLCKDDAEFWVGSNIDQKQLVDENKSFKDILSIQGINLFPEGKDDSVIIHTFSTVGIRWDENWVEHVYKTDKGKVYDILMSNAAKLTPEFIYGDYNNIDLPFDKHKRCDEGEDKIFYTILNCLREDGLGNPTLPKLLLDIHRSHLERLERQARFMAFINSFS